MFHTWILWAINGPGTCERPLFWGLNPRKEGPTSIQNTGPHLGSRVLYPRHPVAILQSYLVSIGIWNPQKPNLRIRGSNTSSKGCLDVYRDIYIIYWITEGLFHPEINGVM